MNATAIVDQLVTKYGKDSFGSVTDLEHRERTDASGLVLLHAWVMRHVPSPYVEDVFNFIAEHDDAPRQLHILQQAIRQVIIDQEEMVSVEFGELILGRDDSNQEQLEFYARISASRERFEAMKEQIWRTWTDKVDEEDALIFPMLIRRPDRV